MTKLFIPKILGGIGSTLIVISPFISVLGIITGLSGIILLLIALKNFSNFYNNKDIFQKFLIGLLIGIAGSILGIVIQGGEKFNLAEIYYNKNYWKLNLILGFLVMYISTILACYFYKESLYSLFKSTNHKLFDTAGKILFYSAILVIIFGLGGVGLLIGWTLLAISFFTFKN